ncbi:SHOCT domain-containing protein [Halalkaliarchaeum desulfuricum]|nr:SHOCT domain-containing protein [Halalkaliarchaeum desulfuricum]
MQSLQSAARTGRTVLVVSLTLLIGATGSAVAQVGSGAYGGGMMNDGWGWGLFGGWGFLWLLLLVGIAAFVVSVMVSVISGSERAQDGNQPDQGYEVLRKQYARGNLSDEEFERRRGKLQN